MILLKGPNWTYFFVQKVLTKHIRNLKAKLKREKLQGINTSSFPELA